MQRPMIIGAIVVASSAFSSFALLGSQQTPPPQLPAVAPLDAAGRIGVTLETMAASGLSGSQAAAVLATLADSANLVAAFDNAELAVDSAGEALTAAKESARGPFANSESPAAVAVAEAAFQSALAARDAARSALFVAATAALAPGTQAKLAAAALNGAHSVPTAFTVVGRTPEAWLDIESALVAEARAARMGTTLAEEHSTLLAAVRAEEAVVAAQTSLDNGIAAVQAACSSVANPGGE